MSISISTQSTPTTQTAPATQAAPATQTAPAAKAAPVAKTSSTDTTNVSTTVTSTDPSVLQNQINKLSSAITQLQQSGGSASQIQKFQQAEQTAKNQILKQTRLDEAKKAAEQSSNIQTAVKENGGLDIQA